MRRIVVTGGGTPLAGLAIEALRRDPHVEHIRGVETRASAKGRAKRDLDFVPLVPDHRPFGEYLAKERIDTIIQCGLAPDRSGLDSSNPEADVISTMCLGAAIGGDDARVRSWVIVSSSSIYPVGSHTSLLQREEQRLPREEETTAASIAEAEDYARDVALRLPHVNVVILRLQQLCGPGIKGALASLLAHDPVPTAMGFDPSIQLLHAEDAASAIAFAATHELAGIYNVASQGVVHLHEAVRRADRTPLPLLPVAVAWLEPVLERLGVPFLPAELLELLRFGHALDTQKIERSGWRPGHDQRSCLASLAQ